MYNYNHLYYFYVTAKAGGVTSASTHLRISQPSLSSQLKVLEQSLDLKLFQKSGRTIELTHSGAEVFSYCRQMFEFSEKMSEAISKKIPTATRRISIGVSDQIDRSFVSDVVSSFLKKFDDSKRPKVSIITATHNQLIDKLKFKEFDAILSDSSISDPQFHDLEKVDVPVVMASSMSQPHVFLEEDNDKNHFIEKLSKNHNLNWILPTMKFRLRSDIDRFLESHRMSSKVAFESDSITTLAHAVADDIGLAFFPLLFVNPYFKKNTLRLVGPIKGLWNYQLNLNCHAQNKDDHLVLNFAESFRNVCQQMIS